MKRYLIPLFLMVGGLFAEYDVGDVLPVPVTKVMLTISRDTVTGRVVYKDDNMYLILTTGVDTAAIDNYIAQIPPLFDEVKASVLSYLNLTEDDLYDSDNDSRIFLVITPMEVSAILKDLGIQHPTKFYGMFDPNFTVSGENYSAHEYIHLNCRSQLSPSNLCDDQGFVDSRLRKVLYFLYTDYVIWSLDRNERNRNILRGGIYIASKVDTLSDYSVGFDEVSDIMFDGAPYGYDGTTIEYDAADIISSDDKNAEMAFYWFNFLEEHFGEDALVSAITSPQLFSVAFDQLLSSRNLELDSLVVEFNLKMALNGLGFGYDFASPLIPDHPVVDIFHPLSKNVYDIFDADTVPNLGAVLSGNGALGFRAKNPVLIGKLARLNYPDGMNVKVYLIDSVAKTVTDITADEVVEFPDIQIYSKVAYFINLTGSNGSIWEAYDDTTAPNVESFFVKPDFSALNVFHVYGITDEEVCYDVGSCTMKVGADIPGALTTITFDASNIDTYDDDAGTHYVYYSRFEVPTAREGDYKFFIYDAADAVENKVVYTDTVVLTVGFATAGTFNAFEREGIYILPRENAMFAVSTHKGRIFISSEASSPVLLKVPGTSSQSIYRLEGNTWIPVKTHYSDGYLFAEVEPRGEYRVMTGKPAAMNFNVNFRGRTLYMNLPSTSMVKVKLYGLNGRLIRTLNTSGAGLITMDLGNIPSGVYYLDIETDFGKVSKKVVLY